MKYHVWYWKFSKYISSWDLFLAFQTHISKCLLDISTYVSIATSNISCLKQSSRYSPLPNFYFFVLPPFQHRQSLLTAEAKAFWYQNHLFIFSHTLHGLLLSELLKIIVRYQPVLATSIAFALLQAASVPCWNYCCNFLVSSPSNSLSPYISQEPEWPCANTSQMISLLCSGPPTASNITPNKKAEFYSLQGLAWFGILLPPIFFPITLPTVCLFCSSSSPKLQVSSCSKTFEPTAPPT